MKEDEFLTKYFTVFAKPRTYTTLLYLFLAFPLGLTYFILMVVGFSLGLSLLIIWVGFLILALLFPMIWMLISFERLQTTHLLGIEIPTTSQSNYKEQQLWPRIKSFFSDPTTWKGILFILLKFPLGIASFTILVTGISILFVMIFAPILYQWTSINFIFWNVDTISEAIGVCFLGLILLPGLFHLFNFVGQLIGRLSKKLLS